MNFFKILHLVRRSFKNLFRICAAKTPCFAPIPGMVPPPELCWGQLWESWRNSEMSSSSCQECRQSLIVLHNWLQSCSHPLWTPVSKCRVLKWCQYRGTTAWHSSHGHRWTCGQLSQPDYPHPRAQQSGHHHLGPPDWTLHWPGVRDNKYREVSCHEMTMEWKLIWVQYQYPMSNVIYVNVILGKC